MYLEKDHRSSSFLSTNLRVCVILPSTQATNQPDSQTQPKETAKQPVILDPKNHL